MHESPSVEQLLQAVISFLTNVAAPQLSGQAQFHARISANALAIVMRELAQRDRSDTRALALYGAFSDKALTDLRALEAAMCDDLRVGKLDIKTPGLLASLREVASAQLAVDQPHYSGLK